MTLTYTDINKYLQAYSTLATMSFSFQTAYKLSKLNRLCKTEQDFFNQQLEKIIYEFAVMGDDGKPKNGNEANTIMIRPDQIENCKQRTFELEATQVTIDDIVFEQNEFDNVQITPDLIESLIPFMV